MNPTHEIDEGSPGTITPGGNPVCNCGKVIFPGQYEQHLRDVIAELQDELEIAKANSIFEEMEKDGNCGKCISCGAGEVSIGGLSFRTMMVVCPMCGNKRCPKASFHDNPCTGLNIPGQEGSVY